LVIIGFIFSTPTESTDQIDMLRVQLNEMQAANTDERQKLEWRLGEVNQMCNDAKWR
jgi:hypothetical protein